MDARLYSILVDSFGKILIPGLMVTIPLTAIAFTLALLIAVVMAMVQFANIRGLKQLARFYIWVIRGIPLLVQLYVVFYGLPRLGVVISPFPAAVIVFSINEGAYAAEIIRAALESVPIGQLEAGYCVGMSCLQTMRRIILPQALKTAFPSLSNSLIAMVKDTSLAANITVTEMFMVTQRIVARTYEPLALYIEIGLIYLMFSTVLTRLQRLGEQRLGFQEKKMDGINEKGLCVAVLMIEDSDVTEQDTGKPGITTTTAVRLLLDQAADVDEAIRLLEQYDMNSSAGIITGRTMKTAIRFQP